ncbi:MAG TPA: FemAB family XrtA/PEP-CTERM system-associated protein [Rhizomicrobium sp.]|jgi:FemAB-related protein (PEP-CTERM system-associated)
MEPLSAKVLDTGGEAAWDAYVRSHSLGTFFHLAGWKRVIEEAFGHRTFYLVAERQGAICGILPLTQIKSLLFGNSLISNAFCVRGGIVASDAEANELLRREAIHIGRELDADSVEFRSSGQPSSSWQLGEPVYVNFRRAISDNDEVNLNAIPRKQRAMVRKGSANGLKAEIDHDVRRLHQIYAESVRRLGTPVFSRRYFQLLKREFGDACDVLTVVNNGRPIASVMNFYFKDDVLPYYGGGLEVAREVAGNDFMYWEVMRRAAARGCRFFDFGRSKRGTGAYNFKRNWGFEPESLSYEYFQLKAKPISDRNPLSPKYQTAIKVWQHLPLSVTKIIGPLIVRSIG